MYTFILLTLCLSAERNGGDGDEINEPEDKKVNHVIFLNLYIDERRYF